MLSKLIYVFIVLSTVVFTYWFAFVYEAQRHPNTDLISAVFMGVLIGWCFWIAIGLLISLWKNL